MTSDTPKPLHSDAYPAPKLHDAVGCIEWCAHCSLCGVPVLYGARCSDHYGMYPDAPPEG
jgi:hypothetical protein